MNQELKKAIAVSVSAALLILAVYGSYLPMRKSRMYIKALQDVNSAKSLKEFEDIISEPLDAPSPVGQEELVRNTGSFILSVAQSPAGAQPAIMDEALKFLYSYYNPIIKRGRGMSFAQNLYLLGAINEVTFTQSHDPKYAEAARQYYDRGLVLGPSRPQFLYGLYDVYRAFGDVEHAKEMRDRILAQWPSDQKTKVSFEKFLSDVARFQASSSKK